MKMPVSIQFVFAILTLGTLHAGATDAIACDLQRGNEVYLDARAEVAALPQRDKDRVAQEWAELETEQKSLWALAGEIDEECRKGELSPQVVPYNARVYDWQDRLRKFLKRVRTPTESPSGKPEPQPVQATAPTTGTSEIEFPSAAPAAASPSKPHKTTPAPPPQAAPTSEPLMPKTLL